MELAKRISPGFIRTVDAEVCHKKETKKITCGWTVAVREEEVGTEPSVDMSHY